MLSLYSSDTQLQALTTSVALHKNEQNLHTFNTSSALSLLFSINAVLFLFPPAPLLICLLLSTSSFFPTSPLINIYDQPSHLRSLAIRQPLAPGLAIRTALRFSHDTLLLQPSSTNICKYKYILVSVYSWSLTLFESISLTVIASRDRNQDPSVVEAIVSLTNSLHVALSCLHAASSKTSSLLSLLMQAPPPMRMRCKSLHCSAFLTPSP